MASSGVQQSRNDFDAPQQAFPQILEFSQLLIAADLSCCTGCSFSSRSKLSRDTFLASSSRGIDVSGGSSCDVR